MAIDAAADEELAAFGQLLHTIRLAGHRGGNGGRSRRCRFATLKCSQQQQRNSAGDPFHLKRVASDRAKLKLWLIAVASCLRKRRNRYPPSAAPNRKIGADKKLRPPMIGPVWQLDLVDTFGADKKPRT